MTGYKLLLRKFLQDRLALSGFLIVLTLIVVAVFAPSLAPYPDDAHTIHLSERFQKPSLKHFFGTDNVGRDIFSRVIFGARVSLTISIIAVGSCLIIGVPIGLIAGFYESWLGEVLMRTSDIFLSIPRVVLPGSYLQRPDHSKTPCSLRLHRLWGLALFVPSSFMSCQMSYRLLSSVAP